MMFAASTISSNGWDMTWVFAGMAFGVAVAFVYLLLVLAVDAFEGDDAVESDDLAAGGPPST